NLKPGTMPEPIQPIYEGDFIFAEDEPLGLESGGSLQPVNLRYSIYGELNERRDNAILVCHALSGSARVGDWWPQLFGEHGIFDLSRDSVICANLIGSCCASPGPKTINPVTSRPFGASFPIVTVRDWVRSQAMVLDHLGVERLRA